MHHQFRERETLKIIIYILKKAACINSTKQTVSNQSAKYVYGSKALE